MFSGDFGLYHYRKYLNGKVILITGNYEDDISDEDLYEYGFDEIYRDCYEIIYKGETITMQHKPSQIKDRRNLKESGLINLFGHVHNNENNLQKIKNRYNIGVDVNNFIPMALNELIKK